MVLVHPSSVLELIACIVLIIVATSTGMDSNSLNSDLRSKRTDAVQGMGGRTQRMDQNTVTIDLSALRPSLPGLVLHKYGELAPKLVQVDLDILNPFLQPHIIWPQFTQQDGGIREAVFDFVNVDTLDQIPFLQEDDSLLPGTHKTARMTASSRDWPDFRDTDGDIYDFLPNSERNEDMMILQQSLPMADEVIIPLDWEEGESVQSVGTNKAGKNSPTNENSRRRQPMVNHRNGGYGGDEVPENIRYTSFFDTNGWRPGKRVPNEDLEKEGSDESKTSEPTVTRNQRKKIRNEREESLLRYKPG